MCVRADLLQTPSCSVVAQNTRSWQPICGWQSTDWSCLRRRRRKWPWRHAVRLPITSSLTRKIELGFVWSTSSERTTLSKLWSWWRCIVTCYWHEWASYRVPSMCCRHVFVVLDKITSSEIFIHHKCGLFLKGYSCMQSNRQSHFHWLECSKWNPFAGAVPNRGSLLFGRMQMMKTIIRPNANRIQIATLNLEAMSLSLILSSVTLTYEQTLVSH